MEIKKEWVKMFKTLWYLTVFLLVVLVLVGIFWNKFNTYFQQVWPSFIGTCFGVVFSAGFAGAFLVWQMTREEKAAAQNSQNDGLADLKKWEAIVSGFISKYTSAAPKIDAALLLISKLAEARGELKEIRMQAGSLKVKVKDIKIEDLDSAVFELSENIDELNWFLSGYNYGNVDELNRLFGKVKLNFTKVQSISSGLTTK